MAPRFWSLLLLGALVALAGCTDELGVDPWDIDPGTLGGDCQPSARHASTLARYGDRRLAAVNRDADSLTIVEVGDRSVDLVVRKRICDRPRTVSPTARGLVVSCQDEDAIAFADADGRGIRKVSTGRGTRPYGVVALGERVFATLRGTGEIVELGFDADGQPQIVARRHVIDDARGLTALPDGRLAVTRWRSPEAGAQVAVVDPAESLPGAVVEATWTLARMPTADVGQGVDGFGGVPSYLSELVVAPDGRTAALPGLQANTGRGVWRDGRPLEPDSTVRAQVSFVDLAGGRERPDDRHIFSGRGLATSAAFSPSGRYLYLSMRGSRAIERLDLRTGEPAGTIAEVGYAPEGVALSADGDLLFVDAYLSRELVVYDVSQMPDAPGPWQAPVVARFATADQPALDPELLEGKQLFNDSADPRLSAGAIACAHCHLEGEADGRTWDLTDRGEGVRNTPTLRGRAGARHGPLNWSASFDEVHDYENAIRQHFGGQGLLSDAQWEEGTRRKPLGDPKANLSDDLDALSAYVSILRRAPLSPYRAEDASLSEPARRGQAIFESARTGCTDCHGGARMTDSQWLADNQPLLHDVGTLRPHSGARRGEPLVGLDTPTLHGVFNSAPYLHDGSAATLYDVLVTHNPDDRHGRTSGLSQAELADLIAYLRSLDGRP